MCYQYLRKYILLRNVTFGYIDLDTPMKGKLPSTY